MKSKSLRFSQRIGKKPLDTKIQLDYMNDELKNSLWNIFKKFFLDQSHFDYGGSLFVKRDFTPFFELIYSDFFKKPLDILDYSHYVNAYHHDSTCEKIRDWYFIVDYLDIYDFIDWITRAKSPAKKRGFIKSCNIVLERENSGYRFVGEYLAPITNEKEIGEIVEAISIADQLGLSGVETHLKSALLKLSDRQNPDYRNSIKESISAVESISKIISGKEKATLGDALKSIEKTNKVSLHNALKKGFSSIYGYTSSADGIRHAMTEESKADYDDAKYMLVSCSAFVNYLISKAQKADINFNQ